jgi:hypothetical protein
MLTTGTTRGRGRCVVDGHFCGYPLSNCGLQSRKQCHRLPLQSPMVAPTLYNGVDPFHNLTTLKSWAASQSASRTTRIPVTLNHFHTSTDADDALAFWPESPMNTTSRINLSSIPTIVGRDPLYNSISLPDNDSAGAMEFLRDSVFLMSAPTNTLSQFGFVVPVSTHCCVAVIDFAEHYDFSITSLRRPLIALIPAFLIFLSFRLPPKSYKGWLYCTANRLCAMGRCHRNCPFTSCCI